DWARGSEKNIRTWGQLGLTGDWADKPINMYGFSIRYNTATDFSDKVLKSSDKWNENIHAYGNIVNPDGSRYIEADQITDNLGKDRDGIAYNRYRGDRPKVKRLAVAAGASRAGVEHTVDSLEQPENHAALPGSNPGEQRRLNHADRSDFRLGSSHRVDRAAASCGGHGFLRGSGSFHRRRR